MAENLSVAITSKEQAVEILLLDLKRAEECADREGWLDADDLERELGLAEDKKITH